MSLVDPLKFAVGIVTASPAEITQGHLMSLLDSAVEQPLRLVVVVRGPLAPTVMQMLIEHPNVWMVESVEPCGVSAARNAGIRRIAEAAEGEVGAGTWIAFPDDDCRYPQGYWTAVLSVADETDLLLGGYDEAGEVDVSACTPLTPLLATKRATSIGILVRWQLVCRIGGFDESLGVGSGEVEGGEDLDYVLHALGHHPSALLVPGLRAIHPVVRDVPADRAGSHLVVARRYWRVPACALVLTKGLLKAVASSGGRTGGAGRVLRSVPVRRLKVAPAWS